MPPMFGMGMGEILLIAVVALLVLGPDRLPGAAKAIGKGIRDLRSSTKDLQSTIEKDTQIGDAVRELRGALRGDPETLYKRATGEDFNAPVAEDGESPMPKEPSSTASALSSGDNSDDNSDDNRASANADASAAQGDAAKGDATEPDEAKADATEPDAAQKELDAEFEKAYANSNDGWGAVATNPHEAQDEKVDPDLPVLKVPSGSVARPSSAASGEATDNDDSSHGK